MSKTQISSVKIEQLGTPEIKLYKDDENLKHLIPEYRFLDVKIHLKKTDTSISNAIRRTLIDELDIKCLHLDVDVDNVETDDNNILKHALKKSIESIVISQDVPEKLRYSLDYINNTSTSQMVTAGALSTDHKIKTPFNKTFRLITVQSGKYLKIKNISIKTSQGRVFGDAMHSVVFGGGHKPLDVDEYVRGKGESSFTNRPTEYLINFRTLSNINIKWLLTEVCKSIISRSQIFYKEAELIKWRPNIIHSSDYLDVRESDGVTHFKLKGETYTISNLIRYFIYEKRPDIALCNFGVPHPSEDDTIINLISNDPKNTFLEALEDIIELFKNLSDQFEKIKY